MDDVAQRSRMSRLGEYDEDSIAFARTGERALEQEGAGEDEPDWSHFAAFVKNLKQKKTAGFIPKRGEKDYAPSEVLADKQAAELETARNALFEALEVGGVRQHWIKNHNRATWHPSLGRASLDPQYMSSVHYRTMGRYHSERKRTELMPEEALYLIERGTLECWTEEGVPMSVQHAYAAMLGVADMTSERYLIYAYLRRLGFAVLRANLASLLPPPKRRTFEPKAALQPIELLKRALLHPLTAVCVQLQALMMLLVSGVTRLSRGRLRCAGPPRRRMKQARRSLVSGTVRRSWDQIFAALQVIPAGHDTPLSAEASLVRPAPAPNEPYRVFFHVYKPINKFRKSDPPPPDYYLAVINVRQTCLFSLEQITALLQSVPLPAPPMVRPAGVWFAAVREWLSLWMGGARKPPKHQKRPANPFPRLKAGRRNVVIALVESGVSTFLRFSEGEFGSLPLLGAP